MKKYQKQNKKLTTTQLFLTCLLGLLADYFCFYLVSSIKLIVDLAISGTISIARKVAVGFLK